MAASPSRKPGGRYLQALRRMHGRETEIAEDDIADVLARISRTRDGEKLLDWIQMESHGRPPPEGAPEGALREHAALNRFATKIFNLVDRGLARNASSNSKK